MLVFDPRRNKTAKAIEGGHRAQGSPPGHLPRSACGIAASELLPHS